MSLVWGFGCQADFVAIELPLEGFFVRLKAAVSSPRPNTNARGAQRRSTLAEGHRRRRRAVLAAASPRAKPGPAGNLRFRFSGCSPLAAAALNKNEPREARHGARILAPR